MSIHRPNFLIVCDHGIRGDHSRCDHSIGGGCSEVDRVALWPWWPNDNQWWPVEKPDNFSLVSPMYGDQHAGRFPERLISGYEAKPTDEPMRFHHEIPCLTEGCTQWSFRSPNDELQRLFMLLSTDERFRKGFPIFVAETLVAIRLDLLHRAHDTAVNLGLLR